MALIRTRRPKNLSKDANIGDSHLQIKSLGLAIFWREWLPLDIDVKRLEAREADLILELIVLDELRELAEKLVKKRFDEAKTPQLTNRTWLVGPEFSLPRRSVRTWLRHLFFREVPEDPPKDLLLLSKRLASEARKGSSFTRKEAILKVLEDKQKSFKVQTSVLLPDGMEVPQNMPHDLVFRPSEYMGPDSNKGGQAGRRREDSRGRSGYREPGD